MIFPFPANYADHYWIVGDTNPTTQVYSTASRAYVANNSAAFLTWLASNYAGIGIAVEGAADNGSGAIRILVGSSAGFQSGQRYRIDESTADDMVGLANAIGVWQVTVIDSTHIDLVGSTYSSADPWVSGGHFYGAPTIDTNTNLFVLLNNYSEGVYRDSYQAISSGTNVTLTNPPPSLVEVTASANINLTLPPADAYNAIPIGHSFEIRVPSTSGSNTVTVKDNSGATVTALTALSAARRIVKLTNTTAAGTYSLLRLDKLAATASADDILTGTLAAARLPQFTGGDVTTSGAGSVNLQIAADTVGNTELANMAQATVKLRASGAGTGDPTDGSATDVMTILRTITRFKSGSFTRDVSTATGTQAVTGVGFQPKAVFFLASMSGGGAIGSIGGQDESLAAFDVVIDETTPTVTAVATAIAVGPTNLTNYQAGSAQSYDSDGFTISWTKVGTPTGTALIFYFAIR